MVAGLMSCHASLYKRSPSCLHAMLCKDLPPARFQLHVNSAPKPICCWLQPLPRLVETCSQHLQMAPSQLILDSTLGPSLQAADTPVQSMSFSPDGSVLAATSGQADVRPDGRQAHAVCHFCGAPCWLLSAMQQALCHDSEPAPSPLRTCCDAAYSKTRLALVMEAAHS